MEILLYGIKSIVNGGTIDEKKILQLSFRRMKKQEYKEEVYKRKTQTVSLTATSLEVQIGSLVVGVAKKGWYFNI